MLVEKAIVVQSSLSWRSVISCFPQNLILDVYTKLVFSIKKKLLGYLPSVPVQHKSNVSDCSKFDSSDLRNDFWGKLFNFSSFKERNSKCLSALTLPCITCFLMTDCSLITITNENSSENSHNPSELEIECDDEIMSTELSNVHSKCDAKIFLQILTRFWKHTFSFNISIMMVFEMENNGQIGEAWFKMFRTILFIYLIPMISTKNIIVLVLLSLSKYKFWTFSFLIILPPII